MEVLFTYNGNVNAHCYVEDVYTLSQNLTVTALIPIKITENKNVLFIRTYNCFKTCIFHVFKNICSSELRFFFIFFLYICVYYSVFHVYILFMLHISSTLSFWLVIRIIGIVGLSITWYINDLWLQQCLHQLTRGQVLKFTEDIAPVLH